jgi:Tol biopolymer transport system component
MAGRPRGVRYGAAAPHAGTARVVARVVAVREFRAGKERAMRTIAGRWVVALALLAVGLCGPAAVTRGTVGALAPATIAAGNGLIAFSSNRDTLSQEDVLQQIYVMNADGSNLIRLTTSEGDDNDPAWSPDGARIAFSSTRDGGGPAMMGIPAEIYVMNADGSDPTRLTSDSGNYDPAWSPDGTRIVFSSSRGTGVDEIHIMNADGSNPIVVTSSDGAFDDDAPVWSPDGSKIAFSSNRERQTEIFVVDPDGTNLTRLTTDGALDPAWSPDGTQIVFETGYEIATMNADGTGLTPLSEPPDMASDREPDWQPLP